MRATSLFAIAVVLAALAGPTQSPAQPVARHGRPRIVVTPRPLYYRRRCTDWLALQQRPSGTVLYPQYLCWWELR